MNFYIQNLKTNEIETFEAKDLWYGVVVWHKGTAYEVRNAHGSEDAWIFVGMGMDDVENRLQFLDFTIVGILDKAGNRTHTPVKLYRHKMKGGYLTKAEVQSFFNEPIEYYEQLEVWVKY